MREKSMVTGSLIAVLGILWIVIRYQSGDHRSDDQPTVKPPPPVYQPSPETQAAKKRIFDRMLSLANLPDDRVRWAVGPGGILGQELPNGGMVYGDSPHERVRDDTLTVMEMIEGHADLLREVQAHVSVPRGQRIGTRKCLRDLHEQRRALGSDYKFSMILHLHGDGVTMRVTEASSPGWPNAFDQEAKDCYVIWFLGREWPSKDASDLSMEFPMSINVGTDAPMGDEP